uniref:Uncharacterized protein n=1 Tax=Manihot esculenta TaxID=3983 RepID=A0A2C9VYT6_MANES
MGWGASLKHGTYISHHVDPKFNATHSFRQVTDQSRLNTYLKQHLTSFIPLNKNFLKNRENIFL